VTEALLARVDAVARNAGAPLLVVLSPTQWQTYEDMWRDKEFMGTGSQNERRFSATAPNERLRAIADRQGLQMIDVLPVFRAEAEGDALPIFRADGHWTAHGHAVAARLVAEALRERHAVPLAVGGG
jgi:hypothetical protein